MPRAKKRKPQKPRKPVAWGRWLWAGLGLSIAAGMWFSPLTAPRKIRVVGVRNTDEKAVGQALQALVTTPWLRVNRHSVEESVKQTADIATAKYDGNIFGRGVLKVEYRRPVAVVDGSKPALLSDEGDIYAGTFKPDGLPHLTLPTDGEGPWSLLATPLPTKDVSRLANDLKNRFPDTNWTINIDARSVIILVPSKGPQVVLGTSERLEEKVGRLANILSTRPDIVRSATVINLTAPDQPVYKP
ncbi:MAG: hypothetical protein JSS65_02690 [Armatimonadetes bacterium]|nr:hypothetical protein [Armatimonadota bacterium]